MDKWEYCRVTSSAEFKMANAVYCGPEGITYLDLFKNKKYSKLDFKNWASA